MRTGANKNAPAEALGLLQTRCSQVCLVPLCALANYALIEIAAVAIDDRAAQPLDLIIGVY